MGGQGRYRDLWPRYYSRADAIVFVLDGNDVDRIGVVRDEFRRMVENTGPLRQHSEVFRTPALPLEFHPFLAKLCINKCGGWTRPPPPPRPRALSHGPVREMERT